MSTKDGPDPEDLDRIIDEKYVWNCSLIDDWRDKVADETAGQGKGPAVPVQDTLPKCLANTIRVGILKGLPMPVLSSLEKLVLFGEKTAEERAILDIQPRHITILSNAKLVSEGPVRMCSRTKKKQATVRAEPQQLFENETKGMSGSAFTWRAARDFVLAISDRKKALLDTPEPNEGGPKLDLVCEWVAVSLAGRDISVKLTPTLSDVRGAIDDIKEFYGNKEIPAEIAPMLRWLRHRSEDIHHPGRRIVFWPEDQVVKKNDDRAVRAGSDRGKQIH
jgi:hypothetical protein